MSLVFLSCQISLDKTKQNHEYRKTNKNRPNRPASLRSGCLLPFKKKVVVDATEMGAITELPNACAIIGGGVIAVEYANVLAGLGVGVSLLCAEHVSFERYLHFLIAQGGVSQHMLDQYRLPFA